VLQLLIHYGFFSNKVALISMIWVINFSNKLRSSNFVSAGQKQRDTQQLRTTLAGTIWLRSRLRRLLDWYISAVMTSQKVLWRSVFKWKPTKKGYFGFIFSQQRDRREVQFSHFHMVVNSRPAWSRPILLCPMTVSSSLFFLWELGSFLRVQGWRNYKKIWHSGNVLF